VQLFRGPEVAQPALEFVAQAGSSATDLGLEGGGDQAGEGVAAQRASRASGGL
jgi:hypothetical protein